MKGAERNSPCKCGSGIKAKNCLCRTAINRIVKFNHPALSAVCEELKSGDDLSFLRTMELACRSSGNGVGLAAPQIGITKRAIFVMDRAVPGYFMLNPVITRKSDEIDSGIEGCLSYPGIYIPVERHSSITVEYSDLHHSNRGEFEGWAARIIQHEIDHLNGICRVGDAWRKKRDADQGRLDRVREASQ